MADAGIDVNSFSTSVSHGIHSITVEDINSYFDGKVTENNSIPTLNTDLKSPEKVLPYAPRTKTDPGILTESMQMLDFILRNSDDTKNDNFMFLGFSSLEKLAHAAHVKELYARTKPIYEAIIDQPPTNPQLCSCVTDDEKNRMRSELLRFNFWWGFPFSGFRDFGFFGNYYARYGQDIPNIESPQTWKTWKNVFKKDMLNQKQRFSLAMYLYCKLKAE